MLRVDGRDQPRQAPPPPPLHETSQTGKNFTYEGYQVTQFDWPSSPYNENPFDEKNPWIDIGAIDPARDTLRPAAGPTLQSFLGSSGQPRLKLSEDKKYNVQELEESNGNDAVFSLFHQADPSHNSAIEDCTEPEWFGSFSNWISALESEESPDQARRPRRSSLILIPSPHGSEPEQGTSSCARLVQGANTGCPPGSLRSEDSKYSPRTPITAPAFVNALINNNQPASIFSPIDASDRSLLPKRSVIAPIISPGEHCIPERSQLGDNQRHTAEDGKEVESAARGSPWLAPSHERRDQIFRNPEATHSVRNTPTTQGDSDRIINEQTRGHLSMTRRSDFSSEHMARHPAMSSEPLRSGRSGSTGEGSSILELQTSSDFRLSGSRDPQHKSGPGTDKLTGSSLSEELSSATIGAPSIQRLGRRATTGSDALNSRTKAQIVTADDFYGVGSHTHQLSRETPTGHVGRQLNNQTNHSSLMVPSMASNAVFGSNYYNNSVHVGPLAPSIPRTSSNTLSNGSSIGSNLPFSQNSLARNGNSDQQFQLQGRVQVQSTPGSMDFGSLQQGTRTLFAGVNDACRQSQISGPSSLSWADLLRRAGPSTASPPPPAGGMAGSAANVIRTPLMHQQQHQQRMASFHQQHSPFPVPAVPAGTQAAAVLRAAVEAAAAAATAAAENRMIEVMNGGSGGMSRSGKAGVRNGNSISVGPNAMQQPGMALKSAQQQQSQGQGGTIAGYLPDGSLVMLPAAGLVSVGNTSYLMVSPPGSGSRVGTAIPVKPIKTRDPLKPGDWICPNVACRYHNFARRVTCVACGTSDSRAGRI
ncbi:hypothetical protein DFJ73DRAFT_308562 [Zopfochytrium polystomum]|nr:hypothetical protein DFJ73DRAFT_308562 [Zopfochytrium polystomum]